ncbi:spore protease YyaC [Sporosalibacterium faouarense]|uniref:spore protease YyaC n=1 Tax=Sporosalibacterium faouarense TaxID=516123 RepID=UPI00141C47EE|nr:spore protease YyaC [Sporosalibacterium faouarense]MTI46817.1 spore protease YyaC [Bacillota bacterium]
MNNFDETLVHYKNNLSSHILRENLKPFFNEDTIIVCIGTDKCIGDCLGPLVGTLLKKKKFPNLIYGTLNDPIHAVNIKEKIGYIKRIHPSNPVIAIDACLGEEDNVGNIQIRNSPIFPGKGVGKKLPSIGDVSVIGIIDTMNDYSGLSLHSIRLSLVMEMAEVIVNGLCLARDKKEST